MKDAMGNQPGEDAFEENQVLAEGDLIELINEEGETVPFLFVDALEYGDDLYLALTEPEEDDAVFFLRISQDENGNDVYTAPDEALEEILFERFMENRSDVED